MLEFKRFDNAVITIADVELLHCIHKGKFSLGPLRLKDEAAPAISNVVPAVSINPSPEYSAYRKYLHLSRLRSVD